VTRVVAVGDVFVDVAAAGEGHAARIRLAPGGSAPNAAAAAARAGAAASVVGKIGDDPAGRMVVAELTRAGVEPLLAAGDRATGVLVTLVRENGAPLVLADRGANAELAAADLPAALAADAVLVSGYLFLHDDTRAAGIEALARAPRTGWRAVDAASAALLHRRGAHAFLTDAADADLLLADDDEAEILVGARAEEATRRLGERFRAVVVKRGPEGAVAVFEGAPLAARAPEVHAGPVLGAGDAFAGTLLAGLAGGARYDDALARACEAGAAAVEAARPGVRP
jgi:ribokinase